MPGRGQLRWLGAGGSALNAPENDSLPVGWWKRVRHDLRSTVAPMRMAVQLLRTGRVDAAEREEALQVIDRQLEQLLAAVDDIGDLMHAQAGSLSSSAVYQDLNLLPDIVCGRGALVRDLATRNLQLRCAPCAKELLVEHDPMRLSALLEFLLQRLAAHAKSGDELLLSVHEDGGGALRLSGAGASLAQDPELLYLQGIDAGRGEPGLRAMLMRQLLRAGAMELQADGEGALRLRFPAPRA
jgi:K+-sensing histidine kinase KdpD